MFTVCSHLRFLNLNNTGLATWDEVDRIAQFPALMSLRVQVCFVLFFIIWFLLVKRVPFVVVSLSYRLNAELHQQDFSILCLQQYLFFFLRHLSLPQIVQQLCQYPRFSFIESFWRNLVTILSIKNQLIERRNVTRLSSRQVTLTSPASDHDSSQRTICLDETSSKSIK